MHSLTMGLEEALRLTLQRIQPLPFEEASLQEAVGRVAAMELSARIDSPAQATSRKDGYALRASDAASATPANPARLRVLGRMAAGGEEDIALEPGATVRVLTGARIPEGADTVVAEEYTSLEQGEVLIDTLDDTAKNILPQGGDVALGQPLLGAGQVVSPVMAGLLAAAGHHIIPVRARPRVGILGTGDEIVAPGRPLKRGELYASNIITLAGFCERQGMAASLSIVGDQRGAMRDAMSELLAQADALITSGGAWRGDRDLVAEVLGELGWQKVFHRIRMGPGKAVGFGLLGHKPVFLLPGGPPSNLMGFFADRPARAHGPGRPCPPRTAPPQRPPGRGH